MNAKEDIYMIFTLTNPCSMMTVAVCLIAGREIIGPKNRPAMPLPPGDVANDAIVGC
jgi:hypothetical protein